MKVLLDEQLPLKLKYRFMPEIEVSTVRDENWLGEKKWNADPTGFKEQLFCIYNKRS